MIIQNVKGGYDYGIKEQGIRNYINNIISKNFMKYGYNPIETSILCYYDMLSDKYEEDNDLLNEIYKLRDQGDRQLGLRYDLTVPFAKYIALNKNNITLPFKRFEIAKVFRDGPVKVGRDREFTQCDADVVGIKGQVIEAELLSIYVSTFKELDIPIYIKYNSRNLMTGLILESGVEEKYVSIVTTILDKKDKVSNDELINMLLEKDISKNIIDKLLSYFNLNLDELNNLFKDSKNIYIINGLEEINNLYNNLCKIDIIDKCRFDITLARGQNYYTGNVFEVYESNGRLKGSIGGGGRYDKMISNFINDGEEYPTVGISFGLSSIYELLKDRFNDNNSNIDIYIIPIGTEIECLNIANKLRNKDFKVEIDMNNRKLKKSLDYANKQRIKYVIVIGDNEINNNKIIIKNMFNGINKEISIDDIDSLVL